MRDITGIELISVIVHIFSPRVDDEVKRVPGWIMSDEPMDLTQNQPACDFVKVHIRNVLADQNLRPAKFTDLAPDRPGHMTDQLIKKPDQLIPLSQKLAKALFDIMERDRRTSICDLAVCLFTAGNYPGQRFVALLKLDPSTVFHNQVNIVNGKQVVNLVIQNLAFTTERLQKAALIQGYDDKKPYDLLLLDTQVSAERATGVAIYFRKTFLGCELVYDSTQLTGDLWNAFIESENQLIRAGHSIAASDFRTRAISTLQMHDFSLGSWLDGLPYKDQEKKLIEQVMRAKLITGDFLIDPNRVSLIPLKARFRGSNGLIVEINLKNINDLKIKHVLDKPGKPSHWEICIDTLTLVREK
jgi:hypothetical protein